MKKSILLLCATLFILSTQPSPGEVFFTVRMDSTGTGVSSPGRGSGYCILSADFKTLTYRFTVNNLKGPITNAHFHFLPTSGVIHQIAFTGNTSSGTWTNIPDTLLKYFFTKQIYINVHTSFAGAGEIRGVTVPRQSGFKVSIDSTSEGSGSSAMGSGYVLIRTGGSGASLEYRFTYAGLSAARTGSHFHALPSGSVVHPITFTDSTSEETWANVPDSILTLLLRGKLYVNIHSSVAPGGEIRGTPTLVGVLASYAKLQGTSSSGAGTAWAVLTNDLSRIQYSVTYARLGSAFTGGHFHTNVNGSVVHPFVFGTGNTTTGEWTQLTDVNIQDYLQNRLYANIHSTLQPSGEINGILQQNDGVYTATFDGAQASTSSTARGTGVVYIQNDSVKFLFTVAGLNGTYSNAHIHASPSGTVLKPTPLTGDSTTSGVWFPIADSARGLLYTGNLYFNVHSSINPGGEIRGNIGAGNSVATSVDQISSSVPVAFNLRQNYPNPFNPSTTIEFDMPAKSHVSLKIYNMLGQEVAVLADEVLQAGNQKITFDASQFASGIYFYRLSSNNGYAKTMKMLLLK
jgi:hypothetical protein